MLPALVKEHRRRKSLRTSFSEEGSRLSHMDFYILSIKVGPVRGFPSGVCGDASEEGSWEEVGVLVGAMWLKSKVKWYQHQ